jgi:hypothetical protein
MSFFLWLNATKFDFKVPWWGENGLENEAIRRLVILAVRES